MSWGVVVDEVQKRGLGVAAALAMLLTGCSFLGQQVAALTANDCIERQCNHEQGQARQQCMTSCQRQYVP